MSETPTLPDLRPLVVMGEYGVGKSEMFATLPGPRLVIQFDPFGKAVPYIRRGILGEMYLGEFGQEVWPVFSKRDPSRLITQIELYEEEEPTEPRAFQMLFNRFATIRDEVAAGLWRTVILETFSSMELSARYRRTHGALKSDAPNIFSTEDAEQMLSRFKSLKCNVAMACHIDTKPVSMNADIVKTDKKGNKYLAGGQLLATPLAPGRLQKGIGANFASELYRLYTATDEAGNTVRLLQTQNDGKFACATRIDAPDGCEATYAALWSNWLAKHASNGNTGDTAP